MCSSFPEINIVLNLFVLQNQILVIDYVHYVDLRVATRLQHAYTYGFSRSRGHLFSPITTTETKGSTGN